MTPGRRRREVRQDRRQLIHHTKGTAPRKRDRRATMRARLRSGLTLLLIAALTGAALQGITTLDGPGSEGLTRRQTYTVTEIRDKKRTELFSGRTLVAVPSNVGPATIPDYPALAAQGIYSDNASGIRVFAGQRAETFYIDLGAVFDTLNLRRYLPLLTGPGEDTDT